MIFSWGLPFLSSGDFFKMPDFIRVIYFRLFLLRGFSSLDAVADFSFFADDFLRRRWWGRCDISMMLPMMITPCHSWLIDAGKMQGGRGDFPGEAEGLTEFSISADWLFRRFSISDFFLISSIAGVSFDWPPIRRLFHYFIADNIFDIDFQPWRLLM